MRSIPNMTILETGDATEVEGICQAADSIDGPVYCRVLRGSVPRLFTTPIKIGEMRELAHGTDVLVVTAGITTEEAMRARDVLEARGVSVLHLHINTIKPFNAEALLDHIHAVRYGVITMENHVTEGGLGSLVAEILAEAGAGKRLLRLGLKDTFAHGGSRPYLMRFYGLDAFSLVRGIESVIHQELGISEDDLNVVRQEIVHSKAKAEAL
jgi:transketolase